VNLCILAKINPHRERTLVYVVHIPSRVEYITEDIPFKDLLTNLHETKVNVCKWFSNLHETKVNVCKWFLPLEQNPREHLEIQQIEMIPRQFVSQYNKRWLHCEPLFTTNDVIRWLQRSFSRIGIHNGQVYGLSVI